MPTPHAGPRDPYGQPTGWHAPSLDDAPVLLACLDDDPDRLFVLGGYYDPNHPPPVTGDNLTENLYRSASGNTLLMDDRKARELVRLYPANGLLHLELNAKEAAHWAGLVTPQGAIEQAAGKTIAFISGDSHIEQIDNDRIQQVENRSRTQTKRGKIHHQAGSDIQLAAGESIHIEAGQDVEISAGGDFSLTAEQDAIFQVRHGDQLIKVNRGEVHIQAAGDIWIEGDGSGPITLMQNDGGVQIGTQGDMTLFGKAFTADFAEVNMSGDINYEVPGGAPAPKLKLRPPLEPLAIEDLVDPREPVERRIEQETVALVPVRYAVDKKAEGEAAYAYSAPNLAQDLPELQQAQYVLRRARSGWLYLLLNGKLYEFEIDDNASLIPELKNKAALEVAKIKTENQALLLPKAAGSVWLAYAEHPWTDKQRSAMEAGSNRHQQMQRFELTAPGKDAFELSELPNQVADYGGPGGDFAWSDTPGSLAYDLNGLQAELLNAAEAGQQVVALHDPIGISHDLAALVEEGLGALVAYLAEPEPCADQQLQERYRKRLVAETIERLYESRYNPGTDAETLARLRREHWRAEPAHRGKPEPSLAEFQTQVRTDMADSTRTERYAKHVDEAARQAFLNGFNAEVARLQQQLDSQRLDRLAWLKTWQPQDNPRQLGAAWATFDMDDEADWHHFEHSFARSQASLIGMAPNRTGGLPDRVMNKEIALFDQWLKAPESESPLYRALSGHPPFQTAMERYREQRLRDEQTAVHPGETTKDETAQQDSAKKKAAGSLFNDAYHTAADRSGSITESAATLLEQVYQRFPYTVGTQTVVHTLTSYALYAHLGFTPSVKNGLKKLYERKGFNQLIPILEARYDEAVVVTQKTLPGKTKWYFFETVHAPSTKFTVVTDTAKGQPHAGDDIFFRRMETKVERNPLFGKGAASPLRGLGTVGISGIAGVLYLVNLKRAVKEFDTDEFGESITNLGSAIAAVGGGINSGLLVF